MRAASIAMLLVAFVAIRAEGQQLGTRPVPIGAVESFGFDSPSMGVRYAISVAMPSGYKREAAGSIRR